jgi:mRNA interferase MazF
MIRHQDLRWAVVLVQLDPVEGHEQAGQRPVLVVSYEPFHRLSLMTIVPITSARIAPRLPGDVAIPAGEAGLSRAGVIICSQIRTIAVRRMVSDRAAGGSLRYITSSAIRRQVREALAHHLALDVRAAADGADGAARFGERP